MNIYVHEIDAATITVTANYTPQHTLHPAPYTVATKTTTSPRKQLLPIYSTFALEF